jgi:hypothetical protein
MSASAFARGAVGQRLDICHLFHHERGRFELQAKRKQRPVRAPVETSQFMTVLLDAPVSVEHFDK